MAKPRRLRSVLPSRTNTSQLYNALELPHLDYYCSAVWQECSMELRLLLERVQNHGMHIILAEAPRTYSEELRQELGWTTLEK